MQTADMSRNTNQSDCKEKLSLDYFYLTNNGTKQMARKLITVYIQIMCAVILQYTALDISGG